MFSFKEIIEKTDVDARFHPKELHETLKNHYNNFSRIEKHAIFSYTGSGYTGVNDALWHGREHSLHPDLSEAMNKHKTPHAFPVYSGIKYDPRENMNSEGIVYHPGYLSTSIRKSMAQWAAGSHYVKNPQNKTTETSPLVFHQHMLKIRIPKGHPGAYVDHISCNPGEHEFILPSWTKMKHKRTITEMSDPNGIKGARVFHHVHDMEIVK